MQLARLGKRVIVASISTIRIARMTPNRKYSGWKCSHRCQVLLQLIFTVSWTAYRPWRTPSQHCNYKWSAEGVNHLGG